VEEFTLTRFLSGKFAGKGVLPTNAPTSNEVVEDIELAIKAGVLESKYDYIITFRGETYVIKAEK